MNLQAKELLKARFLSLKDGNHSLETAGIIAEQIRSGVESGISSWEELGTTSEGLDKLLKKFAPAAYVPRVAEFKKLWHAYREAEDKADLEAAKKALLQIKPVLQEVRSLMQQHLIAPQALMPCNFFELQEALKEVCG